MSGSSLFASLAEMNEIKAQQPGKNNTQSTQAPSLPPVPVWNGRSRALIRPASDPWVTPAELSGFRQTPSYDATVAWLRRLAAATSLQLPATLVFDISIDHTRARVAAYLQQWGDRIQRSVFICAVAPDDLDTVNTTLATMINPNTDAIHLLPACATCWTRRTVHGQAERHPDRPYWAIL